jgi:hypothetical protein
MDRLPQERQTSSPATTAGRCRSSVAIVPDAPHVGSFIERGLEQHLDADDLEVIESPTIPGQT